VTAPTDVHACYRHPDRFAGITCQRCDRPICPSCMHQASVGFHCPECASKGRQKVYQGMGSWRAKPLVTPILVGINVVVFVATLFTAGSTPRSLGGRLLVRGGYDGGLFADGALVGSFVPDETWRLVSSGFLHANLLHIGFNMWVLWVLGQFVEPAIGRLRFTALYVTSLFGGALGVVLLDPTAPTVGASGAIFGLMGGALLVARENRIDLMRSGLLPTLVINLLITFTIPNISIGGHLGGAIVGAAAGAALTLLPPRLGARGDLVASGLTLVAGLALAGVSYALMVGEYGHVLSP
jgi:membrane associated rhomboid family serine protease